MSDLIPYYTKVMIPLMYYLKQHALDRGLGSLTLLSPQARPTDRDCQ